MSLSRIRLLCIIPLFVLIAAGINSSQASASTFYVSTSGRDSNPGTLSAPFASPSKAVAAAAPGDTIYLRQGTYTFTSTLVVSKDGLTLSAYQNEKPALAGSTTDLTNLLNMIYITANNVSLVGLEIQGGSYYGVKLESNTGT
ncbi:MAG: right-handed parallel beta-helix repeat-containing protein, partial [Blastocatellia bacterium]